MLFKIIFFSSHLLLIKSSIFFIYKPVVILNAITIISWYINNNNCIITQIEDKLFNQTLIDVYNNLINKKKLYNKFRVPRNHRYFIHILFIIGMCYQYFKNPYSTPHRLLCHYFL